MGGRSSDSARLELALTVGVDVVVEAEKEDAVERICNLTDGYGADVVVECAGSAAAIDAALDMVRRRGRYSQMGLPGVKVNVDFEKVAFKELEVTGGLSQRRPAWIRALALMESGAVRPEKLISHELPLSDWHHGPQRQDVVTRAGGTEVMEGDGTKRRFVTGGALVAEGTTGQGHTTGVVGGGPRLSMTVPLAD